MSWLKYGVFCLSFSPADSVNFLHPVGVPCQRDPLQLKTPFCLPSLGAGLQRSGCCRPLHQCCQRQGALVLCLWRALWRWALVPPMQRYHPHLRTSASTTFPPTWMLMSPSVCCLLRTQHHRKQDLCSLHGLLNVLLLTFSKSDNGRVDKLHSFGLGDCQSSDLFFCLEWLWLHPT